MKLFLSTQVEEISYGKYGGSEGLEHARHAKVDNRLNRLIEKRKRGEESVTKGQERLEAIKSRLLLDTELEVEGVEADKEEL